jgi:hypothetical protein
VGLPRATKSYGAGVGKTATEPRGYGREGCRSMLLIFHVRTNSGYLWPEQRPLDRWWRAGKKWPYWCEEAGTALRGPSQMLIPGSNSSKHGLELSCRWE